MENLDPVRRQPPGAGADFGRYRIERRLGMGGMGVVYAARDTVLDRLVALKVIAGQLAGDDEFRRRFQREAGVLARLDSPHVIAIYDHGEHDGVPFIATQYVAGGDLGDLLEASGPLPPAVGLQVAAQVTEALADAHRAGVVHRDVKAANVLLRSRQIGDAGASPHVYLADFGIALSDGAATHTSSAAGSWAYLSPERLRGAPATPASDLYAVGCLLWACLTGAPPYTGSDAEVVMGHVSEPVPHLEGDDDFTRRLDAVLARALAKTPEDRWQDAAELQAALLDLGSPPPTFRPRAVSASAVTPREVTRLRGGTPVPVATAPSAVEEPPGPGRRATDRERRSRPLLAAGAVALTLALLAGVGWWIREGRGAGDDPAPAAPSGPVELVTGDADGDGLGDLTLSWLDFSLDSSASQSWLLTSDGESFAAPTTSRRLPGTSESLSDIDGDGALDRIAAYDDDDEREVVVDVVYADGRTEQLDIPRTGVIRRYLSDPIAQGGDFDGDGYGDVLLRPEVAEGTGFTVVPGGPDGLALEPGTVPTAWLTSDDISIGQFHPVLGGDVDGDGDDDLVISVSALAPTERTQIAISEDGEEGREFAPDADVFEVPPTRIGNWDAQLVPADVDGDGTDELLGYRGVKGAGFEVLVHDVVDGVIGEGTVIGTESHRADTSTQSTPSISDVDGDGDDDLVLLRNPDWFTGDMEPDSWAVDVMLAEDGRLGPAQRWADVPCRTDGCEDESLIVTS
ncbi:serine/threonine-protein kinase [Nocardioides nanhaiensis]|uniref:non-specific serine/threonine protein kinase n=1 Tax=Nocardioides nanhaiensis TaxID=1476871 RepID=A0ABP8VZE9_9ACTN